MLYVNKAEESAVCSPNVCVMSVCIALRKIEV